MPSAKPIPYAQREAEALAQLALEVCIDPSSSPEHVHSARARLAADAHSLREQLAEVLPPGAWIGLHDVVEAYLAQYTPIAPDRP